VRIPRESHENVRGGEQDDGFNQGPIHGNITSAWRHSYRRPDDKAGWV
jgi:hypothetical protein